METEAEDEKPMGESLMDFVQVTKGARGQAYFCFKIYGKLTESTPNSYPLIEQAEKIYKELERRWGGR